MKRFFRRALILLLVIVGAWSIGARLLAGAAERAADKAWADAGESVETFLAHHPKTDLSPAARRIEEQAARLGLDLAWPHQKEHVHASDLDRKAFSAIRLALIRHVDKWPPRPPREAAPPEVAAFLSAHATEITAIEEAALGGDLSWESDVEQIPPFHNLLGSDHRPLHEVLLADVAEKARLGRRQEALLALEATFRHTAVIASRPELVSQLLTPFLALNDLAWARELRPDAGSWQTRVTAHSYRRSLVAALEFEAWALSHYARTETLVVWLDGLIGQPETALGRRMMGPLLSPYARLCVANYSRNLSDATRKVQRMNPCSLDAEAHAASLTDPLPSWNITRDWAAVIFRGIGESWEKVGRTDLDAELTAAVLRIGADRQGGSWPAVVPPIESAVCPGLKWTYSVNGSTMSLTPNLTPSSTKELHELSVSFSATLPPSSAANSRGSR